MAARLYRDFNALKTYGKEPESLQSIISLFNESLADFGFDEINNAMTEHVKQSPEFPTPFDIITIIKKLRIERERKENITVLGVDDTMEKLREYDQKRKSKIPLTSKEYRTLQESGWKLLHD